MLRHQLEADTPPPPTTPVALHVRPASGCISVAAATTAALLLLLPRPPLRLLQMLLCTANLLIKN